jgi:hypothetical protein
MEIVIRQQKETICKLSEENQLIKSKLKLIENQLSKLTNNNQENNINDRRSPPYAYSISSVTSLSDNDQLADSNTNLNS